MRGESVYGLSISYGSTWDIDVKIRYQVYKMPVYYQKKPNEDLSSLVYSAKFYDNLASIHTHSAM